MLTWFITDSDKHRLLPAIPKSSIPDDKMAMKQLKPIAVQGLDTSTDGYRLQAVADQWAELLPSRVPLRFSFFRYLGFYVAQIQQGQASVLRSNRAIAALHVSIRNDEKEVFADRVPTAFRNGVFYVQDIRLDAVGRHTVTVTVEGSLADQVPALVLETKVFEFMTLDDCDELQATPYSPLRDFVLEREKAGDEESLRDDAVIKAFLRRKTHSLRLSDAKVCFWK